MVLLVILLFNIIVNAKAAVSSSNTITKIMVLFYIFSLYMYLVLYGTIVWYFEVVAAQVSMLHRSGGMVQVLRGGGGGGGAASTMNSRNIIFSLYYYIIRVFVQLLDNIWYVRKRYSTAAPACCIIHIYSTYCNFTVSYYYSIRTKKQSRRAHNEYYCTTVLIILLLQY